jgi:putative transcription factor
VKNERLKNSCDKINIMTACEICGSKTAQLFKVSVEGTEMITCQKCTRFGKVISQIVTEKPEKKKVVALPVAPEKEETVVKNYSAIIRNAREKSGMTQEDFAKSLNERLSVIRSMEHGKIMPDLKLAKKLEHLLGIRLIEEVSESKEEITVEKSGQATLGDVIKIKKKD